MYVAQRLHVGVCVIRQTDTLSSWLHDLHEQRAEQNVTVRLQRLKFGHFGDVEPVGHGVSELRIHAGKACRVYFRHVRR